MKDKFNFGQEVRVTRNVRNDGTFPGREMGELLLRRGSVGFVRDIGSFLQDQVIYSVDFIKYGYRVGCREEELIAADDRWIPNRYEFRDEVTLNRSISVAGEVVAEAGSVGSIEKVVRDTSADEVSSHLRVSGRTFLVTESMLDGDSDLEERVNRSAAKGLDVEAETRGSTLPWQSR